MRVTRSVNSIQFASLLRGIVVIGAEFYGSSSSSIVSFQFLETLILEDMDGWEEWECKFVTSSFPRLRELCIVNCPKVKGDLPKQLTSLMKLKIYNCKHLVASVPWAPAIEELDVWNCGKVRFDHDPPTLKILSIGGRYMKKSLLERIGHTISHTCLEKLLIEDCPNVNIPRHHFYNFLVELFITGSCDTLRTLPLDFFPKLRLLTLKKCSNLEILSQEHSHNLTYLSIEQCPKFVSFPKGGFSAPRLERFQVEKLENLKSLPGLMHLLPSLTDLEINDCPLLESFGDGGLPSNLKHLYLSNCSKLMPSLKWALGTSNSLVSLHISTMDVESFPDQGLLPVSLASLSILNCPDLKKLDYKGLCHLSSFTRLCLGYCPRLQCLPEEGLPKSISTLYIRGNCGSLNQHCRKPNGKDWGKISHIECIRIGGNIIT